MSEDDEFMSHIFYPYNYFINYEYLMCKFTNLLIYFLGSFL